MVGPGATVDDLLHGLEVVELVGVDAANGRGEKLFEDAFFLELFDLLRSK